MCTGSEFQVTGAEMENASDAKLLVMPDGLARRLVLEEGKDRDGRCWAVHSERYGGWVVRSVFQVIRQSLYDGKQATSVQLIATFAFHITHLFIITELVSCILDVNTILKLMLMNSFATQLAKLLLTC